MIKTYSELITLPTFEERFKYLQTNSVIGEMTFGGWRYLNQMIYHSTYWKNNVKSPIIIRDKGCDLAIEGRIIYGPIYIHHLNPITKEMILNRSPEIFDPENLICMSFETHNALHYGNIDSIAKDYVERTPNDTILWKK